MSEAKRIEITAEGIVYRNPRPHVRSRHAYFPWVICTGEGRLTASFVLAEAFESVDSNTYISHSSDEGATWSEPQPIVPSSEMILSSNCARITGLGNGRIVAMMVRSDRSAHPEEGLANPENMGFAPTDLLLIRSMDNGYTWEKPEKVNASLVGPSFEACSPIVVLHDSRWIWPTSTWRGWDGHCPNGMKMVALVSNDEGKIWSGHMDVMDATAEQVIYWEGKIIELNDGRMLATAWAFDEKTARDLPNHYTISNDKGKTWTAPQSMNIIGQTMATVQLDDGRIAVVYRRMDLPGLWLNILNIDDALSAGDSICIWSGTQVSNSKRENMVSEFNELKFGAPCITKLPGGSLFISFWCYEHMVSNIRWAKVKI